MFVNATVTLKQPLSHIGESIGIEQPFNRQEIVLPDGSEAQIPFVSGNSVRGILRDAGARYLCDRLGFTDLPLSAFYILFSGGALTKGGSSIKLDEFRELVAVLPLLKLLGTAAGNVMVSGRFHCGHMLPIAIETRHMIPDAYFETANGDRVPDSVYELMYSQAYSRKDDAKDTRLDTYHTNEDNGAPQQMRYHIELMQAGARLYWSWHIDMADKWCELALVSTLRQWSEYPALGGKSGTGHGLCEIEMDNGWFISAHESNLPDLSDYDEFLDTNSDRIREWLYERL